MTRAKFEILSTDEVTRIHDASLDVLANAGAQVDDLEARKMVGEAGAKSKRATGSSGSLRISFMRRWEKHPRSFSCMAEMELSR